MDKPRTPTPLARDVVCGMLIAPADAAATSRVHDITFYFCSTQCQGRFDADPGQFVPELA